MSFQLETEKDVERLRQAALLLEAENRRLTQRVVELTRALLSARGEEREALQLKLAELERQLAQRTQELFGPSSEKRPRRGKPGASGESPARGHGPRAQPTLPLIDVVHTLDEADKQCPQCGGALQEMKGCFEEAEEVDVVERRFVLKRHLRQKYRCGCGACVDTALGPQKLIPGGRYSLDFAIEVAIQKYLDHMPLERQVRTMERQGLAVDSQTLWDQVNALAKALAPVHEALHAQVLGEPVIGVDETRWPLLGSPGQSKWHAWAVATAKAVVYRIAEGRGAEAARDVLRGYSGTTMTDGYAVYDALARASGGRFNTAHCWAHVRRKFLESESFFPEATTAIARIGELYAVEREHGTGPPELLLEARRTKSRDALSRLHAWALSTRALPQSALGRAIAYMTGLWPGLTRFLDDVRVPLDNNATERALRGLVVGRKNHYGSKSQRGTEVAAILYSLTETAKLCDLNPKAYLRAAALAALRGEPPLLPAAFASHATTVA